MVKAMCSRNRLAEWHGRDSYCGHSKALLCFRQSIVVRSFAGLREVRRDGTGMYETKRAFTMSTNCDDEYICRSDFGGASCRVLVFFVPATIDFMDAELKLDLLL